MLGAMDQEKLRDLICLMVKRFSMVATGGPRNRHGQVVSHKFTLEFQELWLTHSLGMVGRHGTITSWVIASCQLSSANFPNGQARKVDPGLEEGKELPLP